MMQIFFKKIGKQASSFELMLIACFLFFFTLSTLTAAPKGQSYQDLHAIAIREMRNFIEDVRHEVNNHEAEIRIVDEKLKNFDLIIESVRDQLNEGNKSYKEQLRGCSIDLESKIAALEVVSKSLVADLRQFKDYSNETSIALTQYKQKIGDLEKIVDQQNQNIEHLQTAMRSLMDALQGKAQPSKLSVESASVQVTAGLAPPAFKPERCYKVKSGDSLQKIARSHETTIQALKEINGLTTDRIVVGKTLILPEK